MEEGRHGFHLQEMEREEGWKGEDSQWSNGEEGMKRRSGKEQDNPNERIQVPIIQLSLIPSPSSNLHYSHEFV